MVRFRQSGYLPSQDDLFEKIKAEMGDTFAESSDTRLSCDHAGVFSLKAAENDVSSFSVQVATD